ncbi:MAG: hypothetical protein QOH61_941 [Chloroflexota bacterium]|jgi:hypothetical protein|nr:hypothetical protein [Chloroflexota bacterium]
MGEKFNTADPAALDAGAGQSLAAGPDGLMMAGTFLSDQGVTVESVVGWAGAARSGAGRSGSPAAVDARPGSSPGTAALTAALTAGVVEAGAATWSPQAVTLDPGSGRSHQTFTVAQDGGSIEGRLTEG